MRKKSRRPQELQQSKKGFGWQNKIQQLSVVIQKSLERR